MAPAWASVAPWGTQAGAATEHPGGVGQIHGGRILFDEGQDLGVRRRRLGGGDGEVVPLRGMGPRDGWPGPGQEGGHGRTIDLDRHHHPAVDPQEVGGDRAGLGGGDTDGAGEQRPGHDGREARGQIAPVGGAGQDHRSYLGEQGSEDDGPGGRAGAGLGDGPEVGGAGEVGRVRRAEDDAGPSGLGHRLVGAGGEAPVTGDDHGDGGEGGDHLRVHFRGLGAQFGV